MIVALPGLFSYLFLEVKLSIYLNRRVFVMVSLLSSKTALFMREWSVVFNLGLLF